MAKNIRHELRYDAPVEEVAAMLGDPAFREEVCEATRVTRHEVTVDGDPAGAKTVRIEQWQPAAALPGFARKLVGPDIHIVQEERWGSSTHADVTVTIPGKPGEMAGTAVLAAVDGGTVETVDLTIKVRLPVVGGKVEDLVANMLLKALKAENTAGAAYLSR